jgi:hypothetical protein
MNFTITTISYLKDLSPKFKIESTTKWRYHYLDQFTTMEVHDFIRNIKNDNVYLIIPNISTSRNINDPKLILSLPFLVKRNSNPELITKLILDQWHSTGFFLESNDRKIEVSFKFKRIWVFEK